MPDLSPYLTPAIALLAAAIAGAQWYTARSKLSLDLFNQRMEVYEGVPDEAKFEWELAEIAGRLKIQDFLLSGTTRHVECFES